MATPVLPPPPLDTDLSQAAGKASPTWSRWLRQLWDATRNREHAHYVLSVPQSVPDATFTVVNFETAVEASANVTVGSAWKYTAPTDGVYFFAASAVLELPVPAPAAASAISAWYKNGVLFRRDYTIREVAATGSLRLTGSIALKLVASDYVSFVVRHATGAARNLTATGTDNYSWITVQRMSG